MRKIKIITLFIIICIVSCGADKKEIPNPVDTSGMETMYTTAYNLHGITATGVPTHPGICACNTRLGQVALIYSMDGQFLMMAECVDVGGTEGLKQGRVCDVWFDTMEECERWMSTTGGRVKILWIDGKG